MQSNIKEDNYILISSFGYFSKKKFNECLVDLNQLKVFNVILDSNGNSKYEFYKDLTDNQKNMLLSYINDNDLLNVNIDIMVFDASDNIEISIGGKKNVIRNASKEFTNNEMHIFDDIVNIVFNNDNSYFNKIKNFFNMNLRNDKKSSDFINKTKIDENRHEYEEIKKLEECPNCNEKLLIMGDNKANLICPKCKAKFISFDGKIYSVDKMTKDDFNNLISNIDNEIAELEIQKTKIDEEVEKKFQEVSNYSIMNKSLEDLLSAKKKFINDWNELLLNATSELWIIQSATYRVHIASIIDAILLRVDDNVSKQQLELLNSITNNNFYGKQELEFVIKVVKQLKELE